MSEDCKKPTAGFWIAVALVAVLLGYPLSEGPVLWLQVSGILPNWLHAAANRFYFPLDWLIDRAPTPIQSAFLWYLGLFRPS
jgi:hypothetical protein